MKRNLFFYSIIITLLFWYCAPTFKTVNIISTKEHIIDSCLNYVDDVPLRIERWDKEAREHGDAYYAVLPIYHKKKMRVVTGYYTITSKPYYYLSGRDSIVGRDTLYFTIIKQDDK